MGEKETKEIFIYRYINEKIFVYKADMPVNFKSNPYVKNRVKIKSVFIGNEERNPDFLSLPDKEFECKHNTVYSTEFDIDKVKSIFIKCKEDKIAELKKEIARAEEDVKIIERLEFNNV